MSSFFDQTTSVEASHHNGFAGNRLDRLSEARDETSLAAATTDPRARFLLFAEERALITVNGQADAATFERPAAEQLGLLADSLVLLGSAGDGPRLAGLIEEAGDLPETVKAIDLRSLANQGLLKVADLGAVAQARSMLSWHANHQYCARCGQPTLMRGGGVRRDCPACSAQHFPRVDPVAIMLTIGGTRCVMGRQAHFAPGMYSALAGFVEPGETIEDAVRRETKEEAGIEIGRVRYHSSQPWPFVSSLMIGCHCEALTRELSPDESELEDCRWFEREEVRAMIAGSHPEGLVVPPRMAIANRLICAFAEWDG
jgi:NAD+ diphosphatase